ncbi:hypothetical protein [Alcaligenes sp. WGS1538]|uniref:Btc22 family type III secretion system chaperone n=1 Tax=Alcaligenes sp. WGS1538 TaxID=3366811 RepID=UPI00372D46B3
MGKTTDEVMREAEALIEQVQRSLESTVEAFRDQGLDPEKLPADVQERIWAESQALFRKDMEDVEREVAQEVARLSFAAASPRASVPRKLRNMI